MGINIESDSKVRRNTLTVATGVIGRASRVAKPGHRTRVIRGDGVADSLDEATAAMHSVRGTHAE